MFKKLRCILFVPIMKADNARPDFWYLRPPFLWLPTEDQLDALEVDYRSHPRLRSQARLVETSRAGCGFLLTLNTSDSTTAGKEESKKRRAWWLTKDITNRICEQNLWPQSRGRGPRCRSAASEISITPALVACD